MENAEGGEMFDYIVKQRHVEEPEACRFFHQIVDGLDELHKNDITHRDLKPENLLLKKTPDGYMIKIVDFGLSNTHEGGRMLSTACGSPCYAPPEMIAGKKYDGPKADIWSLGVTLFALVCGYLPFEDGNTSLLYKKILAGDYKPPKWISNDVKDLISKILETDPKKRYTLADIRKHEWYKLASDNDIPHDFVSVADKESIHNATMKTIVENGHDAQAILDGVASHACNGLTALYYLLLQKNKNSLNRLPGQAQLTTSKAPVTKQSDVVNPQLQADNLTVDIAPPIDSSLNQVKQQARNVVNTNVNKIAPNIVEKNTPKIAASNVNTSNTSAPIVVRPNMNPVSLANNNNYSGFTQSTNPYLQMAKPQGKANSSSNIKSSDGNGVTAIENNLAKMNLNAKPNIPTLNLHNNSNNIKEVMVSQTSRPNPSAQYPSINNSNSNKQPQSARPVLPTDQPPNFSNIVESGAIEASMSSALADILGGAVTSNEDSDGRPSTRRSRARSRGDGDSTGGSRDRSAAEQNKINYKELATGIESFPAPDDTTTNVPVTINTENVVDRDNAAANAIMMPMFTVQPPDMSTRKSDSSNGGGRRGKNIT